MFAVELSQHPELDITDDLNEEEIQSRLNMIDSLNDIVGQQHAQLVQKRKIRIRAKIEQKRQELQKKKDELINKENELEEPDSIVSKICTPGNLFVIQFDNLSNELKLEFIY